MKKLFVLIIISVFFSFITFSQLNEFFVCDSSIKKLYPDIQQIQERFHDEVDRKALPRGFINEKLTSSVGDYLQEEEIEKLRPIVFMRVFPDTLTTETKYISEQMTDRLMLWNHNGLIFPWILNEKPKSLFSFGNARAIKFQEIINDVSSEECIYFVYLLKDDRFFYPYLAYKKNGNYIIIDREGNEFYNFNDLIIKKYESIENYIKLFKEAYSNKRM